MNRSRRHKQADPDANPSWSDEPDIGSGEKTPADHETDELIRQIPPLPPPPALPGHRQHPPASADLP